MLADIPIVDLTAPTLLGIGIIFLLTGRLHTRFSYMEKKEEADRWRAAYEVERDARITSDAQTVELLEVAKTTHDIISAMFMTVQHDRLKLGAPDDVPPKA